MKVFRYILLIIITVMPFANPLQAGLFDDRYPSARATAMGGAGVAVANDIWASYYNPAGLSQLHNPAVGTSYLRLFNAAFLRNFFGSAVYPLPERWGTLSAGFQYFGVHYQDTDLSGEYTLSLSHGFYLMQDIHSSLALGYSLKGYFWSLGTSQRWGDLGSAGTFGMDVGLLATLYSRTFVGVYFLNVNSPQIGEYARHDLPQRIVAGIAYQPYDGVTTSLDFNRTIGVGDMQLWGGAEFEVFQYIALRFGGTTNPSRFSAGVGLQYSSFKLDYALLTHADLGETHQIGFMLSF
ncbi:MAG: hypothetical protein WAN36_08755 [Calditrichia bacterium]